MENKENKRLIQWYYSNIILNIIFLIIFWFIISSVIMPWYSEYSNNKETLITKINNYEKLQKDWLSFWNFSSLITDTNTKTLVSKIWADFFSSNLKNNSNKLYLDFLKDKEKKINELKKSDTIKFRDEKVSKILPSYQEWVSIDWSMTDLEFVNYIESLLRTFRLKTESKIWINELVLVEDKTTSKTKNTDTLSSQIFYIPLKLDLEWAKSDVVDFLYFLQNVWRVESVRDNDIVIYRDNVINRRLWNSNWSNIYENKIVDIDSIEFKNYLDTSSFIRSTSWEKSSLWFLYFIRNWVEKSQAFRFNLSLRFYVKWLPTYKIESYLSKTVELYKEKVKLTNENLKIVQAKKWANTTTDIINIISNLRSIETYLSDLDQSMKKLELGIKEKNNLEKLYTDATKARYDIDNISSVLNENIKKVKNLSSKK